MQFEGSNECNVNSHTVGVIQTKQLSWPHHEESIPLSVDNLDYSALLIQFGELSFCLS